MIDPETIDRFFTRYGWRVERLSDEVWRTAFRGDVAVYPLFVKLTPEFVYLTIVPFVVAPRAEARERVYWALLRFNREMALAKFALDEDGDVLLTVELSTTGLDYPLFEEALTLLTHYADLAYREVLNLAQDPSSRSRFDDGGDEGSLRA